MTVFENTFNAEEIAAGIAEWVSIESPSFDAAAVNYMMDVAAEKMESLGAIIDRTPGSEGYGDVVRARFSCGERVPVSSFWDTWIPFTSLARSPRRYR